MSLNFGSARYDSRHGGSPLAAALFFPLGLFYLELVVKAALLRGLTAAALLYTLLFSLPIGLVCALLSTLWSRRINRRVSLLLMGVITFWYMAQAVYYTIFKTFLTLFSIGGAGKVLSFWREILFGLRTAAPVLLLLALPMAALCALGRRFTPDKPHGKRFSAGLALLATGVQALAVLAVVQSTRGVLSPRVLYQGSFIPELSVSTFGVATTLRLDAKQLLLSAAGQDSKPLPPLPTPVGSVTDPPPSSPAATAQPKPTYAPNVLDIDFEALAQEETNAALQDMHRYFAGRAPTMKNEFTGCFAGKNLIFITAEGFSSYAVDPELTPTLYKLANNGFVFSNFYNPLWWVSTSDGEYAACTSLIPKPGVWSFYQSRNNDMYFCLGNQFSRLGYTPRAYHNHTWSYYNRDLSHPNMGYDYKGLGKGLPVKKTWPESDLEMMELSLPEYINDVPFHTYYMTVSGHMNYTFMGNSMSKKHQQEVSHLSLSEPARAYLACQMELDRALAYLLEELEAAGQLENTVIALSADHYPYGLEKESIDELAGHTVEEKFELYRSTLILWSGDMTEPVVIDKPCDSLDILPTLSNLFGLPYDSRLLMGQDILSDSPGLVVLSDRSFLTKWGSYNAATDTFTPTGGASLPEGYALGMARSVQDMFAYSVKILERDYYGRLGLPQ